MEVMSHELICSWLGLSEQDWPPDHYRLLGLEPGEDDTALIEQRCQQRLDSVRRYQMMHPEQATEAMNRLAQAFVCLTEPESKKQYDADLLGRPLPAVETPADVEETSEAVDESNAPTLPSLRLETAPPRTVPTEEDTVIHAADSDTVTGKAVSAPPPLPAKPPPLPVKPPPLPPLPPLPPPSQDASPTVVLKTTTLEKTERLPGRKPDQPAADGSAAGKVDPILEAARCTEARRGLGSRSAILRRLLLTRQLLRLWDQVGAVVAVPKKGLSQSLAEKLDRVLAEIERLLKGFPSCLGRAGQPGYQVVSLAAMQLWLTFKNMDLLQRQSLSTDWQAGRKLLQAHVAFLKEEARALKRQSLWQRLARFGWSLCTDRLGLVLFLLALLALNIAIWRTYR